MPISFSRYAIFSSFSFRAASSPRSFSLLSLLYHTLSSTLEESLLLFLLHVFRYLSYLLIIFFSSLIYQISLRHSLATFIMQMLQLLALALSVASADAVSKGFNYGSTKADGSSKYQADFKKDFEAAKALVGNSGFSSARLYTMIQGGTTNTPIEAIPAAIEAKTTLLLGLWASGGNMDNEIAALKSAISQYGDDFANLVVGISVGSEDMYRNSVTGSKSNAGPGVEPEELVSYIQTVRSTISGTGLADASIGHVDTWDSWTNSSNSDVVNHLDWLGFDGYPYFQLTMENGIENAKKLFDDSVEKTKSVANGKEVWITETGWPVSGPQEGDATASIANAKQYWDQVGCPLFGNTNTWWYMLEDEGASPSFGVVKSDLSTPVFDLSCSNSSSSGSSSSAAASSTSTGAISNKDSIGSGSGSGSGSSSSSASSTSGSGSGSASSPAVSSHSTFPASKNGTHASSFQSASHTSTPLTSATASSSSSSGSGSSGSGSGSISGSGSGSGTSGSSDASSSGSAASPSSTAFNAATRTSGSTFGAIVAAAVLAIAV
jgi:glucan endo-1,3-beta-D-glucosidase